MRRITIMAAVVFTTLTIAVAQPQVQVNVAANFSFDDLNQYGEWVSVSGYGEVWRPYASPEWRPFVYGQWVWSNDGWMWESDEPFGWIVCHYGNWYFDDDWGWVWIPGYDWSPARVDWHVTDTEIGWMPMLPPPLPGRRPYHARAEWMFCPYNSFAGVEIHSHVSYRPYSSTVVVRRGPPKIEVVRSHSSAKIVTVAPRKVYVESQQRKFVRVERDYPANHRSVTVVPVGPQYRGSSHRSHNSVTVESRPAPPPRSSVVVESHSSPRVNVTVTNEAPRHHVESSRTVEVESSHGGNHGVSKVRVESNSDNSHPATTVRSSNGVRKVRVESSSDDEDENHPHGEVRAKVTVRKKN